MQAWFGYFAKDDDSTKRPAGNFGDYITNIRLKEPTSTTHPVLIVEATAQYNYVLTGNKYYFINEIIRVTDKISEYHCSVDVLATYKNQIGEAYEYVTRATRRNDPMLIDTKYPMTAERWIENTVVSSIHNQMVSTLNDWFMVGLFGRGGSSGSVTYYAMTAGQFNNLLLDMFDISNYSISIDEVSYGLQKALLNPIQYLASVQYFPFNDKPSGTLTNVKFGFWSSTATGFLITNANRIMRFTGNATIPEHPKMASVGTFMNGSPYTRRTLYCYMFGSIPLDPAFFLDSDHNTVHLSIIVDTFTGLGELVVSNSDGAFVYKGQAQMGVSVQISQNAINYMQGLTSVGGAVGSIVSGNVLGAISSIASAASSMMPQITTTGTVGSAVSYARPPVIVSEFNNIAEVNPILFGRPLCRYTQIKELENGFVQIEEPKFETIALKEELDSIKEHMRRGFYYE